jgi:hypothetical protein
VLDAEFLFDAEMSEYLKLVRHHVRQWRHANENALISSGGEEAECRRIRGIALEWIGDQGDDRAGFHVKFRPFLTFSPSKGLCRFFI